MEHEDPVDADESKFICGLSTILVATIQELKDRISHIEFIFCNQLFPKFQSRTRTLDEVMKAAEEEWKKKENSLLSQIEELRLEKEQYMDQIHHLNISLEISKAKLDTAEQMLDKHEYENTELLHRLESLERKEEQTDEIKEQLQQKIREVTMDKELQERLFRQIEIKDHQLLQEQGKRRRFQEEFVSRYKELKSQYNYLARKTGHTVKDVLFSDRMEEVHFSRSYNKKRNRQEEKVSESLQPASNHVHQDNDDSCEETNEEIVLVRSSVDVSCSNISSSPSSLSAKHITCSSKSEPFAEQKRATSCWRNTRANQERGGADPHDDFLDTPIEIARNLRKEPEEVPVFQVPASKDVDLNNSDDETQDISLETLTQQKHISVLQPANKVYKYVEPVRKRAERDNLKGVECQQCKKFYDAVLPEGGKVSDVRCEHHDGVSRHRYRYIPPMTPEGFWNIGFDSEK